MISLAQEKENCNASQKWEEKKKISLKEGKYKRRMFIIQTYKVQTSVNYGLHTKISIILVIHPYPSSQMYNDNP